MSFKSKRGNLALGIVIVLIVAVIFGIFSFFGKYITSELNSDIQGDPDMPQTAKDVMQTQNSNWAGLFDGLFVGVFILFWIGLLISSYIIDTNPVFFIITVIIMIFIFGFAAFAGNVYEEITTAEEFEDIRPQFPATNWIMSHMLELIIAVFFTCAVALYAKTQ